MGSYIDILIDGPPGPKAGRFVEVENEKGCSIRAGTWIKRDDGYWVLRIKHVQVRPYQKIELLPDGELDCGGHSMAYIKSWQKWMWGRPALINSFEFWLWRMRERNG